MLLRTRRWDKTGLLSSRQERMLTDADVRLGDIFAPVKPPVKDAAPKTDSRRTAKRAPRPAQRVARHGRRDLPAGIRVGDVPPGASVARCRVAAKEQYRGPAPSRQTSSTRDEHLKRLDAIWHGRFEQVQEWIVEHGHSAFAHEGCPGDLQDWARRQRTLKWRGDLRPDRESLLTNIARWGWTSSECETSLLCHQFEAHLAADGAHTLPPVSFDGFELRSAIATSRRRYHAGLLSPRQIGMLAGAGTGRGIADFILGDGAGIESPGRQRSRRSNVPVAANESSTVTVPPSTS
jgi:hypothetical protein